MKCKNCGAELAEGTKFCTECGVSISNNMPSSQNDVHKIDSDEMYCFHCAGIIKKLAEICPKCGCRVAPAYASSQVDQSSPGLAVLSFFFPLIGIIMFFVWSKTYPLRAKSCLNGSIIGFIIGIVFYIMIIGCGVALIDEIW